jgi:hypothetical protein
MKHILLITYYFPPEQTPRAFRWEALIKSLANRGYKIDILLPKHKNKKRPKFNNVEYYETKQGVVDNIFYQHILNSGTHNLNRSNNKTSKKLLKIKKIFKKICSFFFNKLVWPDGSAIWYFFAKKELRKITKNNQYDCIISSALPFTSHLLGYYAKKQLKSRWVAEYGDPFSFNPQPQKSILRFLNKKIEKKLIEKMDYIIVPFEGSKEGFFINFPFLKKDKIKVIPQIIPSLHSNPGKIKWEDFDKSKINIVYAGIFYIPIRSPKILLEAIAKLREKDIITYRKLRFHIFGIMGEEIRKLFNKYQQLLKERVIVLYGETSRESCAFAYEKADYMLNIANISEYQLPSKLIEYLSYKKPIISLENQKSRILDWPFLIKVDYQVNDLIKIFRKMSDSRVKFSFDSYDNIIKKHDINTVTQQYINLILY